MATEHFYPDWIEDAFNKNWFIHNPDTKNYKYTNPTKPNKNHKFLFDPTANGVKRGDLICFTENGIKNRGYRNEGVYIWDGSKMCRLYTEIDDYGSVPPEFTVGKEFPPNYWIDKVDHNSIVWLDHDLYEKIEFTINNNNKIKGTIKEYNYKINISHSINKIPTWQYFLYENMQKYPLTINNNKIQLIIKNTYKLYEKTFDISIIDNTIDISKCIDYIQNNTVYIKTDIYFPTQTEMVYYINFNNNKYIVDIFLLKKDNDTIINEIKEYCIDKKPELEYYENNIFELNI